MNEEFLHYLWKFGNFDTKNLLTTEGEPLQIIKKGIHNQDAGPDFSNARLQIGDTTWAGNVEIHTKASDWKKHNHQHDDSYDSIILHVVHENDQPIIRANGEAIPTLELKERIPESLYGKYLHLMANAQWIPCSNSFGEIDPFSRDNWLDRILVERLERKSGEILQNLKHLNNDLEEAFYVQLAGNFGFKINTEPFKRLARSLPYKIIAKHRYSLLQIEALLFGQAGLLEEEFVDDYPKQLKTEYQILKSKFQLNPIPGFNWKFLRTRPTNFPTIRLAQLAQVLHHNTNLFSSILEGKTVEDISGIFTVKASEYWDIHYNFDKSSKKSTKSLGQSAIQNIIINTIVPFLFVYANYKGNEALKEKAIQLLEELPPEKNNIINGFAEIGYKSTNAATSQAVIELKNEYCNHKKCLNCALSSQILKSE